MIKQKTALQELIEWINTEREVMARKNMPLLASRIEVKANKLLEKEKQQMIKAIVSAVGLNHASPTDDTTLEDFEKYYSQTYTSK